MATEAESGEKEVLVMRIAMVSLDQKWEDKGANRLQCKQFIERAKDDRADLVVFPEMTLTGFSMDVEKIGEPVGESESLAWYRQMARDANIAIVAGYVQINDDGRGKNRSVFIAPDGSILCDYAKIHPFSHSREDMYYTAGDSMESCTYMGAKVGLAICYDLRFGELYQRLGDLSDLIITIANWPSARTMHWKVLLQARAIENQVFMIGVNRTGSAPGGLYYEKSSAVFSPFGEPLIPIISDGVYEMYEIDLAEVSMVRDALPVRKDRHPFK